MNWGYIFTALTIGVIAIFCYQLNKNKRYLHRFKKAYDKDLVILDTETSGLNVFHDDIVQIAAVRVKSGKVIGEPFNIFIQSFKQLPPMLGNVPNPLIDYYYSPDCKKVSREEGLKLLMHFVGDSPILGHNVNFDYYMLINNMKRISTRATKVRWSPIRFDTIRLARIFFPSLRSYSLAFLREELHLTTDTDPGKPAHFADVDVQLTKSLASLCASKI